MPTEGTHEVAFFVADTHLGTFVVVLVAVAASRRVYRGEWSENNMHGCGVKLIPKGNGEIVPQEGEWLEDSYIGDVMTCSKYLSRKKAMEADHAARSAREFKVKPKP